LVRSAAPPLPECGLAALSAFLLVLAFPDFGLWPLAWIALVPLVVTVARRPHVPQAFTLGWITGTLFFYGSCWWLTHSMIHYGGIPRPLAFVLLAPLTLVGGLFPAVFASCFARLCARWGLRALLLVPFLWTAQEWMRLGVTGQLWNAIGYSQAFHPPLIQAASWGGVYAVGFLITTVNAALAYALLRRTTRSMIIALLPVALVIVVLYASAAFNFIDAGEKSEPAAVVIGIQPNVPANFSRTLAENEALVNRHLTMSDDALREWERARPSQMLNGMLPSGGANETTNRQSNEPTTRSLPRVVIWPESPMNFTYTRDAQFREIVGQFAHEQQTAVLFNALEPAPAGGAYNSAVMIDRQGRPVAQYDKIRLLPFGEYVPLPRWLPGTSLVTAIVGEFTPGADYPLMPLGGGARAGVFICIESAYPSIARRFVRDGADALINISNDGYLGRTPVLRQHLANTVFRAVENRRPVLRVTNTGISAHISPRGEVSGATDSFAPAVRTWLVSRTSGDQTFYTRHGDLFVMFCAMVSVLVLLVSFVPAQHKSLSRSGRNYE